MKIQNVSGFTKVYLCKWCRYDDGLGQEITFNLRRRCEYRFCYRAMVLVVRCWATDGFSLWNVYGARGSWLSAIKWGHTLYINLSFYLVEFNTSRRNGFVSIRDSVIKNFYVKATKALNRVWTPTFSKYYFPVNRRDDDMPGPETGQWLYYKRRAVYSINMQKFSLYVLTK
jgi:hypothetical protein